MTNKIIIILTLLLSIFTICDKLKAEVIISQSISQSQIAFEDSVHFEILVEWEGSQSAYLFNKPLTPYIDRMKIGRFSSSVSSIIKDSIEFTQKKYKYTLLPTSAGLGLIDPITIAYLKRNDSLPSSIVTEPMEVLILNPVAKEKKQDTSTFWFIIAILLVIVIAIISFITIKKKSESKETQVTPKEKFLLELTTAKNNSESDMKIFQTELFSAISTFLVTEYSLIVSQLKTDSLIDTLSKAGMSIANAEQISKWLQQAEIDKFAPAIQSPGAVIRLESEIRTFFEKL